MRNNVTWGLVFAFLLGMIFAYLTADPSDVLFFKRASEGAFSPIESVLYWYYIPALVYVIWLAFAYFVYRFKIANPIYILYLIVFSTLIGAYYSYVNLGGGILVLILIFAPAILLAYMIIVKRKVDLS